jgi:HicB family
MQTAPYVQAIQADLAAAASLGDEATAEAGRRLSLAVESSLHLRLLDLLTEVSVGLSAQLSSGRVEVRMSGREPELVVIEEEPAEPQAAAYGDEVETARITLRLPEGLKAKAEAAAAREGVSTNTWLVRAIGRALEPRTTRIRTGNRLQGYAQS